MGEGLMKLISAIGVATLYLCSISHAQDVPGTIEKNVDGDTIWVQASDNSSSTKRERLKIRMIGIDAPETHLPTTHGVVGQGAFGDTAAEEMVELAPLGARVVVQDKGLDKYGRTLGRVIVKGVDINLKMVESGWAIPYIICEGTTCTKDFFETENVEAYLNACHDAEDSGLGVFNPKKLLKEMPFEFRLRMQNRKPDKYVGDFKTKELYRPADYDEVEVCDRIFFKRLMDAKKAGFKPTFRTGPGEQ